MITVTERAVQAIKASMAEEKRSETDSYLRVSVKGGGCSGMMYHLSIETDKNDGDEILERDDVRIIVDAKSKLFLHGMTLDYTTGLNGKGFVFSNPNAAGTCGCGESFSV
jgi:iron-sulfur cluster assembly protein